MKALRTLLLVIGAFALLTGLLWVGQGLGLILWPASSFMLADRQWAMNGALLAIAGIACITIARR